VGSNPDVIELFSMYHMFPAALRLLRFTQSQTEMSIMNLSRIKARPALKTDNLTVVCDPIF
jgi:hypothetical protein